MRLGVITAVAQNADANKKPNKLPPSSLFVPMPKHWINMQLSDPAVKENLMEWPYE